MSLLAVLVALIPLWIFLLARLLFQPEGFWQNLVLTGLGIWLMGAIQLVFLVVLMFVLIAIWE